MPYARWLRAEQGAKWAGLSVHFLKELVRKRKITPLKAIKYFLIDRLELDWYLEKLYEQHRHNASSANSAGSEP
jgi:hypothetical protein